MTAQRKGSPPDMTCPSLTAGQIPAALATLCALGLAMVSACAEARPTSTPVRSERNPLESLTEVFSTQEAVDFIGLPFPSGATELHVAGVAALDTMVIARFDAPRQEVVSWLAELGITTPLERVTLLSTQPFRLFTKHRRGGDHPQPAPPPATSAVSISR